MYGGFVLPGSQRKKGNSIYGQDVCYGVCLSFTDKHTCALDTSKRGPCLLGLTEGAWCTDCGMDPPVSSMCKALALVSQL